MHGIPQHPVKTTDKNFEELGLSPLIVDAVRKVGFANPTPIQAAVIPTALTGRDAAATMGKYNSMVVPAPGWLRSRSRPWLITSCATCPTWCAMSG